MTDQIYMQFSATEQTGQAFIQNGEALFEVVQRLQNAMNSLYASGLQGAFLDELQARSEQLLSTLRYFCDESDEAGQELLMAVRLLREVDAACALRFDNYSDAMIAGMGRAPIAAGGAAVADAGRLIAIDDSIIRLRKIQESLRAQISAIDVQLGNRIGSGISALFGYDYNQMRAELVNSLQQTEVRIQELNAESTQIQDALASAVPAAPAQSDTPPKKGMTFGDLLEASTPSNTNIIGNPENLESPRRNQYSHKYTGKTNDTYACALYAQSAVMEAMGHDFNTELLEAKAGPDGVVNTADDAYFSDAQGAAGLGQPFQANGIPYETQWGADPANTTPVTRESALNRLKSELEAGHYPVASFNAQGLSAFSTGDKSDRAVQGHAAWIVGLKTNEAGDITEVIVNDSHWGDIKEYPIDEFMNAWGVNDYYAVFASKPG